MPGSVFEAQYCSSTMPRFATMALNSLSARFQSTTSTQIGRSESLNAIFRRLMVRRIGRKRRQTSAL
jgi:hypothetical protein